MQFLIPALVLACLLDATPVLTQNKHERFQNAEVTYDWVIDNHGDQLRTFITRPKMAQGKVPVIFFVGWLSCDSVEYSEGESDGFGAIFHRLIEQSGYATVRVDKPGVGAVPAPRPTSRPNCPGIRQRSTLWRNTISWIATEFSSSG